MSKSLFWPAFVLVLITAITPIVHFFVLDEMSVSTVLLLRYGVATLFFIPMIIYFTSLTYKNIFDVTPRQLSRMAILALLMFVSNVLFLEAMKLIPVNRIMFFSMLYPMVTLVLAHIFIKEHMTFNDIIAVVVSLLGALILAGGGIYEASSWLGDVLILISTFLYGIFIVQNRFTSLRELHYRQTFWLLFFLALFCIPYSFSTPVVEELVSLSLFSWLGLLYLIFGTTLFGYGLVTYVSSHLKATSMGLIILSANLFTIIFSFVILKESINAASFGGGMLIVLSALISVYTFDKLFSWRHYAPHRFKNIKVVKKLLKKNEELIIDVHSHLDHELIFGKVDELIARAKEAGVRHIITNGINPETNRICLDLSKKYDIIECGMGIYPRDSLKKEVEQEGASLDTSDFDVDKEIEFIRSHKDDIVAISEVGLDFVNGHSSLQEEDFQKMIDLAKELDKPLVVHSRKAEERCIEMLEASGAKKVVMHCFCGKKKLVKRIAENKWSLSIPTSIVRAEQFQHIVSEVPLTQLFGETDSPYLGPYKDQWNEPSFVVESYKKIAEIKKLEVEEVAQAIYMNWQRMFS